MNATGVDFELQGKWSWLEGRASYSYQEVKNGSTGQIVRHSPKHVGKLNLIVPLWSERTTAGVEIQYLSSRRNESSDGNSETVRGYTVANLTLLHRTRIKGLEVSAGAKNLFGEKYSDPSSTDDLPQISAIPRDGRTFWVKLGYSF